MDLRAEISQSKDHSSAESDQNKLLNVDSGKILNPMLLSRYNPFDIKAKKQGNVTLGRWNPYDDIKANKQGNAFVVQENKVVPWDSCMNPPESSTKPPDSSTNPIDIDDVVTYDVDDVVTDDDVDEVLTEVAMKEHDDSIKSPRPTLYEHAETPGGSVYWKPHVQEGIPVPVEGKYYETLDEAIDMYINYAEAGGFQIKKAGQRLTKSGIVQLKYTMCNKEGAPRHIYIDTLDAKNSDKQKRNTTMHVTGSKALTYFRLVIYNFSHENNVDESGGFVDDSGGFDDESGEFDDDSDGFDVDAGGFDEESGWFDDESVGFIVIPATFDDSDGFDVDAGGFDEESGCFVDESVGFMVIPATFDDSDEIRCIDVGFDFDERES